MTVYSFLDLSGAFTHPSVGAFTLNGGNIGMGQITITMTTERTVQDIAADGSIMQSYIAGSNGTVIIEVQQTSILHSFLLNWANGLFTLADTGDLHLYASATLTLRNIVDGTSHLITGISPTKIPDKVYAAQGGKLTWTLMAADSRQVAA